MTSQPFDYFARPSPDDIMNVAGVSPAMRRSYEVLLRNVRHVVRIACLKPGERVDSLMRLSEVLGLDCDRPLWGVEYVGDEDHHLDVAHNLTNAWRRAFSPGEVRRVSTAKPLSRLACWPELQLAARADLAERLDLMLDEWEAYVAQPPEDAVLAASHARILRRRLECSAAPLRTFANALTPESL